MPSILLYEYITGGGVLAEQNEEILNRLKPDGSGMLTAIAEDFAKIPGVELKTMLDHRLLSSVKVPGEILPVRSPSEDRALLEQHAAEVDWVFCIAPESSGQLVERVRWIKKAGGRLLGPDLETVQLASDKQISISFLQEQGISVPAGQALWPEDPWPKSLIYPQIRKPRWGVASMGLLLLNTEEEAITQWERTPEPIRLEPFIQGLPMSVSAIGGPSGFRMLPPFRQFQDPETWKILGGTFALPPKIAQTATELTEPVFRLFFPWNGFLSIDIIVSESVEQAVVLEINPRLSASYIGLRQIVQGNLAQAMLDLTEGTLPVLEFDEAKIQSKSFAFYEQSDSIRQPPKQRLPEKSSS
ncbi:Hypothetical protein PBC10988_20630 [Planctomycetales bacterium 10988]|nr:Hypothetical protein PBC10988_20630 [Planctomycetales bacterium 10988]